MKYGYFFFFNLGPSKELKRLLSCYFHPQCMHPFFDYRLHLVSMTTTSTWMIQRVSAIYLTFQTWILLRHCLELWHPRNKQIYCYAANQACLPSVCNLVWNINMLVAVVQVKWLVTLCTFVLDTTSLAGIQELWILLELIDKLWLECSNTNDCRRDMRWITCANSSRSVFFNTVLQKRESQVRNYSQLDCVVRTKCRGRVGEKFWTILDYKGISGLQITVCHRTMADQNLPMSDEIPTVVGHHVQTIFFAFQH